MLCVVVEHLRAVRVQLLGREGVWQAEGAADAGGGSAPAVQPIVELYGGLFRAIRKGVAQEITPESVRQQIAVIEKIRAAYAAGDRDGAAYLLRDAARLRAALSEG